MSKPPGLANRSRIHMLRVLAMRMEGNAPTPAVEALRLQALELEARASDGRTGSDEENRRIERQRTLFAMLPDCNAADHLREAMMQRAYDLMWDGDGLACDALLEFLPSDAAKQVLDAWESDLDDGKPKSKWH